MFKLELKFKLVNTILCICSKLGPYHTVFWKTVMIKKNAILVLQMFNPLSVEIIHLYLVSVRSSVIFLLRNWE